MRKNFFPKPLVREFFPLTHKAIVWQLFLARFLSAPYIVGVIRDKSGELGTSERSGHSEIQVLFGAFLTHENWVYVRMSMKLKVEKPHAMVQVIPGLFPEVDMTNA